MVSFFERRGRVAASPVPLPSESQYGSFRETQKLLATPADAPNYALNPPLFSTLRNGADLSAPPHWGRVVLTV
ncbi:hypothetical protein HNQ08_005071 [Deinococcus humi]|uniref:Uncharacterized protein n=1 Tax=Deinococcus humi TaxID=662880 RepID=A0A7W8JZ88_9DEIO|nr:hypothetical protein [Deinococcus humi]